MEYVSWLCRSNRCCVKCALSSVMPPEASGRISAQSRWLLPPLCGGVRDEEEEEEEGAAESLFPACMQQMYKTAQCPVATLQTPRPLA